MFRLYTVREPPENRTKSKNTQPVVQVLLKLQQSLQDDACGGKKVLFKGLDYTTPTADDDEELV